MRMERTRATDPEMMVIRDLATNSADIKHLQNDVDIVRQDLMDIKRSLDEMNKVLAQSQGSWKALAATASAGAGVGAFLSTVISTFYSRH